MVALKPCRDSTLANLLVLPSSDVFEFASLFLKSAYHEEQLGTIVQVLCGYQKYDGSLQWDLEIFLDL